MTPEELKDKRIELGYTQEEMAHKLKTRVSTYQKWEQGINKMPDMIEIPLMIIQPKKPKPDDKEDK